MSEDEIRSLTFGVYQVRQAASYIDEYIYVEVILISIVGNQHQTLFMLGYNQDTYLQNCMIYG